MGLYNLSLPALSSLFAFLVCTLRTTVNLAFVHNRVYVCFHFTFTRCDPAVFPRRDTVRTPIHTQVCCVWVTNNVHLRRRNHRQSDMSLSLLKAMRTASAETVNLYIIGLVLATRGVVATFATSSGRSPQSGRFLGRSYCINKSQYIVRNYHGGI